MSKHIRFNTLKAWWIRNFKNVFSTKNVFWSILTIYVLRNWEKCISMEFFKSFNGNNILFIVWILMIIFTIYDIEIKGFKMSERKQKIDIANSQYEINNIKVILDNFQNEIDDAKQKVKESSKNSNGEDIE